MEMKKLILFLVLSLTACGTTLYSGTVTEKHHIPAHNTYQPIIMGGKHPYIIPRWIHHDDVYYVWVQNGEDRDSWYVSEDYYNSVEVGDFITSEQLKKLK